MLPIMLSLAMLASPSLAVSGVRQEAGFVEFFLSGRELPTGTALNSVRVAVAGEVLPVTTTPVTQSGSASRRAVVLVMDTSGSMSGAALTAARQAAKTYLSLLPADVQVGLVSAGAPAKVVLRPTADRAAATKAVETLIAKGETAIYDGASLVDDLLLGEWEQRRIVLLSDGADNASAASLNTVKAIKMPIDTVAFKTQNTVINVLSGLSQSTGGTAFVAADPAALSGAFSAAAGSFTVQLLVRVSIPPALSGKQARLSITAAGTTTELPLLLATDTRVSGPLAGYSADRLGPQWLLIVGVLIFLALLVLALMVVSPAFTAAQRKRRLAQLEQFTAKRPEKTTEHAGVAQTALDFSAQVVKSTHAEGRIAGQLDRAGMRLRPHEWLLLRAVVSLALAVVLSVPLSPLAGVPLGLIAGVLGTSLYHRNRATKRMRAFGDMLPDALQLVIGSLRAGFSLAQALDTMVRDFPDPISTEFGRAIGEARLGAELEDALDRVADRMQNPDLAWAVVAVRVQREVGGNLAEVLTTTVSTIRERSSLQRHVRALSAEGRLSALILLALPVVIGLFMAVFRTKYVLPLVTHPLGILMSIVGVVMLGLGAFWLSRVVKVEV